tara:strand:+ start:235 stop:522 length:288 start_codon:yes stop_codon:yes gene_type:complete
MYKYFTKHPYLVDETYFSHMKRSLLFFIKLQLLSFSSFVHALFPFLFEFTMSHGIKKLFESVYENDYLELNQNRSKRGPLEKKINKQDNSIINNI